ncbi:hypothetical protein [Streptomyces sp. NBC_01465]|uniref:hypothetical protein n=1 Tax=Streptomyces sp. NBC_01465 TaxID=2903878 RepID=UPI002E33B30C|nr:hypothetical protein [Streptomyces sp. NBC_01465]
MPIDPFAALNAMLRAEAARFTPPPRTGPVPEKAAEPEAEEAREERGEKEM